jgi:hypothetical protein
MSNQILLSIFLRQSQLANLVNAQILESQIQSLGGRVRVLEQTQVQTQNSKLCYGTLSGATNSITTRDVVTGVPFLIDNGIATFLNDPDFVLMPNFVIRYMGTTKRSVNTSVNVQYSPSKAGNVFQVWFETSPSLPSQGDVIQIPKNKPTIASGTNNLQIQNMILEDAFEINPEDYIFLACATPFVYNDILVNGSQDTINIVSVVVNFII